ncbi:MAG: SAM-dependent DNA methyltransferase, partial [Candidatus Hydrogenedentota bacterium]
MLVKEGIKMPAMKDQVASRERIARHGEVLTGQREVNAMLDLVKHETERIDSTFLEPACGTGNFLAEILARKLRVVKQMYGKSQWEYERYGVLAVSSLYGIDILEDNVSECRKRLFTFFDAEYTSLYKAKTKLECRKAVRFILDRNIIHGNALTLKTEGEQPEPIVFSRWKLVGGRKIKRHDYAFHDLTPPESEEALPLFEEQCGVFTR